MQNDRYTSPLLVELGNITDVTLGVATGTIVDDSG